MTEPDEVINGYPESLMVGCPDAGGTARPGAADNDDGTFGGQLLERGPGHPRPEEHEPFAAESSRVSTD